MEQKLDGGAGDGRLREITGAIEALSDGFALFDSEDRLLLCNVRFREAYPGLEGLLVPGLPWPIFLAEARRRDMARGLEQIDAHLASGMETPLALEAQRPGGRWVRLDFHPSLEGGFVITEKDVSGTREAEELRAEADDLLREVLDVCPTNIMMCRIGSGEIIYRNPAWLNLFGPQRTAKQLYADPVTRSDFLAELLPTGAIDGFETWLLRAGGTAFPARVSARMVSYKGEEVIVSSTHDMTQVHAQRDEIVRINQRLFDAIEALDQGFALFDADCRLHVANQRYIDVNAPVGELARPGAANRDIVARAIERDHEPRAAGWPGCEGGGAGDGGPYEFSLADGRAFAASRRVTSDGGFVIAWRDVTDQRAAEQELARRREASLQNEKLTALGGLLAGVAHELNNPLSVVVGHAMMLREEVHDPAIMHGIEKISASAERCAKIVKTFLAMARQKPTRLAPASLNATMETALDVSAYGIRASGTTIETRLAEGLPEVLADEDEIAQVFINLIVNAGHAVEALGEAARIVIATGFDPASQLLVASISDNGPGVPAKLRARIFEPFFTTKGVGEGTGVGLALSHRIVGAHSGLLEVDDGPEGGARFTVSLPPAPEAPVIRDDVDVVALAPGLTVLVVEDEAEVAEMIARMLDAVGAVATLARTAEQGLALLAGGAAFDMLLSDLRMPGLSGLEMMAEIEQRWPVMARRVAFITGDAMSREAEVIRKASDRPLLEKPVAPRELYALVRALAEIQE